MDPASTLYRFPAGSPRGSRASYARGGDVVELEVPGGTNQRGPVMMAGFSWGEGQRREQSVQSERLK